MAKYTYEDIIINPEDKRLEGAIGKEVYCDDTPFDVLKGANRNKGAGSLSKIDTEQLSRQRRKHIQVISIGGYHIEQI